MKIKTKSIQWDTDSNDDIILPQIVELMVDDEDDIADALSDIYGFCVFGFTYDILQ